MIPSTLDMDPGLFWIHKRPHPTDLWLPAQGRLPSPPIPAPNPITPDFTMLDPVIDRPLTGW
jgi:hypothetical protein